MRAGAFPFRAVSYLRLILREGERPRAAFRCRLAPLSTRARRVPTRSEAGSVARSKALRRLCRQLGGLPEGSSSAVGIRSGASLAAPEHRWHNYGASSKSAPGASGPSLGPASPPAAPMQRRG